MHNSPKCGKISKNELTPEHIAAINAVLAKDQRVELIPTRDGIRVIYIKREEIKYRSSL